MSLSASQSTPCAEIPTERLAQFMRLNFTWPVACVVGYAGKSS